jgi:hypothetical protein
MGEVSIDSTTAVWKSIAGVDLIGLRIPRLCVILVGVQPVALVAEGGVEHLLRNGLRHPGKARLPAG